MTKIDLITGFLGAGKTTFIKQYARYLIQQGERLCILENDYGAINVDTLLLSDLQGENCDIEMVAGGCDYDCHLRRYKTKLITLAMLGYTRVIVEPSGIYDIDEFYDVLHEAPVDTMYKVGNVISLVNAADLSVSHFSDTSLPDTAFRDAVASPEKNYLLASQTATAGCLLLTHLTGQQPLSTGLVCQRLNQLLQFIHCPRILNTTEILPWSLSPLEPAILQQLSQCGYRKVSFEKRFSMDENGFENLFFMHLNMTPDSLLAAIRTILSDETAGEILRIKGFIKNEPSSAFTSTGTVPLKWLEINATKEGIEISPLSTGQEVLIIIGSHLDKKRIDSLFHATYSSLKLNDEPVIH